MNIKKQNDVKQLIAYDIIFFRGQVEEAEKEHKAIIEQLGKCNFRYDAMRKHLDKLEKNIAPFLSVNN